MMSVAVQAQRADNTERTPQPRILPAGAPELRVPSGTTVQCLAGWTETTSKGTTDYTVKYNEYGLPAEVVKSDGTKQTYEYTGVQDDDTWETQTCYTCSKYGYSKYRYTTTHIYDNLRRLIKSVYVCPNVSWTESEYSYDHNDNGDLIRIRDYRYDKATGDTVLYSGMDYIWFGPLNGYLISEIPGLSWTDFYPTTRINPDGLSYDQIKMVKRNDGQWTEANKHTYYYAEDGTSLGYADTYYAEDGSITSASGKRWILTQEDGLYVATYATYKLQDDGTPAWVVSEKYTDDSLRWLGYGYKFPHDGTSHTFKYYTTTDNGATWTFEKQEKETFVRQLYGNHKLYTIETKYQNDTKTRSVVYDSQTNRLLGDMVNGPDRYIISGAAPNNDRWESWADADEDGCFLLGEYTVAGGPITELRQKADRVWNDQRTAMAKRNGQWLPAVGTYDFGVQGQPSYSLAYDGKGRQKLATMTDGSKTIYRAETTYDADGGFTLNEYEYSWDPTLLSRSWEMIVAGDVEVSEQSLYSSDGTPYRKNKYEYYPATGLFTYQTWEKSSGQWSKQGRRIDGDVVTYGDDGSKTVTTHLLDSEGNPVPYRKYVYFDNDTISFDYIFPHFPDSDLGHTDNARGIGNGEPRCDKYYPSFEDYDWDAAAKDWHLYQSSHKSLSDDGNTIELIGEYYLNDDAGDNRHQKYSRDAEHRLTLAYSDNSLRTYTYDSEGRLDTYTLTNDSEPSANTTKTYRYTTFNTGITEAGTKGIVSVSDGKLLSTGPAGIYDILGRNIANTKGGEVTLPTSGVYLVKVDGKVMKVSVK